MYKVKDNLTTWVELLETESYSGEEDMMRGFIEAFIESEGIQCTVKHDKGNMYIEKNVLNEDGLYPTYVAHIDTVHSIIPDDKGRLKAIEIDDAWIGMNTVSMDFSGIGGDDKCGIWAALMVLKFFNKVKIAFFHSEEMGCVGSGEADVSFFDDSSFVLQTDRRGFGEFTTTIMGTDMGDSDFFNDFSAKWEENGLNSYEKLQSVDGGMTDVWQLRVLGVECPCANVASGYYRPHSKDEFILESEMDYVVGQFITFGQEFGSKQYEKTKAEDPWTRRDYGYGGGHWRHLDPPSSDTTKVEMSYEENGLQPCDCGCYYFEYDVDLEEAVCDYCGNNEPLAFEKLSEYSQQRVISEIWSDDESPSDDNPPFDYDTSDYYSDEALNAYKYLTKKPVSSLTDEQWRWANEFETINDLNL